MDSLGIEVDLSAALSHLTTLLLHWMSLLWASMYLLPKDRKDPDYKFLVGIAADFLLLVGILYKSGYLDNILILSPYRRAIGCTVANGFNKIISVSTVGTRIGRLGFSR